MKKYSFILGIIIILTLSGCKWFETTEIRTGSGSTGVLTGILVEDIEIIVDPPPPPEEEEEEEDDDKPGSVAKCENIASTVAAQKFLRTEQPVYIRPLDGEAATCRWSVPMGYYRESCEGIGPENNFFDFSCADHALKVEMTCGLGEEAAMQRVSSELPPKANKKLSHGDLSVLNSQQLDDGYTVGRIAMAERGCYVNIEMQLADKYKEAWENPSTDVQYTGGGKIPKIDASNIQEIIDQGGLQGVTAKTGAYSAEEMDHVIDSLEKIARKIEDVL